MVNTPQRFSIGWSPCVVMHQRTLVICLHLTKIVRPLIVLTSICKKPLGNRALSKNLIARHSEQRCHGMARSCTLTSWLGGVTRMRVAHPLTFQ